MKTTVVIDDSLYRRAKAEAHRRGAPLRSLIEEGLHRVLDGSSRKSTPYRLRLRGVKGRAQPRVNITDRRALQDLMDGLS